MVPFPSHSGLPCYPLPLGASPVPPALVALLCLPVPLAHLWLLALSWGSSQGTCLPGHHHQAIAALQAKPSPESSRGGDNQAGRFSFPAYSPRTALAATGEPGAGGKGGQGDWESGAPWMQNMDGRLNLGWWKSRTGEGRVLH